MHDPTVNLQTLTAKGLHDGKFSQQLPELDELKSAIENNSWHDKQNVFDHTVKVMQGFETLLEFKDLTPAHADWLKKYFAEKIGKLSRLEILKAVVLLHDIGKKNILVENSDGTIGCPWHEIISADKVNNFSERFGFTQLDEKLTEKIIRYHGLAHEILSLLVNSPDREKHLVTFQDIVKGITIDLIWLVYADMLGSDLMNTDKPAFDERVRVLKKTLSELVEQRIGNKTN